MKKIIIIGILIIVVTIFLINKNDTESNKIHENFSIPFTKNIKIPIPKYIAEKTKTTMNDLGLSKLPLVNKLIVAEESSKKIPITTEQQYIIHDEDHHLPIRIPISEDKNIHPIKKHIYTNTEDVIARLAQNNIPEKVLYTDIDDNDRSMDNIEYPDDDKIIDYDNFVCVKKSTGKQINTKDLVEHFCKIENNIGIGTIVENKIANTCNNNIEHPVPYKSFQTFVKTYLEDPILRAGNISDYDEMSPIFKSGNISLAKDVEYPEPMGYLFNSSTVYNR